MKDIVLVYTGGGFKGSITGWPARDLSKADVNHLKNDGVSIDALIQSGLYEYPPIPEKSGATNAGKGKE